MKKLIIILIFNCLLTSCRQNQQENIGLNSEKEEQIFLSSRIVGHEYVEIDIDTLANFGEMLKVMEEIDCVGSYALFKIETDKKIYKIQPKQFCDIPSDYKLREIIYINTDSITVNYQLKYPIDSLQVVLKNHLLNSENNSNYPSADEKRMLSINIDRTKNISETKNHLLNIINEVNELNSKRNFVFMFDDRGILPRPIEE